MLIRPEKPKSRTIARIKIESDRVSVLFPEKNNDFIKLVKRLGYSWDIEVWYKYSANLIDCAAELGYSLISIGFWIEVSDEVKELIVSEEFEVEPRRKVALRISGTYEGWLVLKWPYGDNLYNAARKISGSRYDKPYVIIPPESYEELEDFAQRYDFYISPAAQKAINEARESFDNALILNIVEKQKQGLPVPTGLIDDDLADKD
jgi:hypothetical protein